MGGLPRIASHVLIMATGQEQSGVTLSRKPSFTFEGREVRNVDQKPKRRREEGYEKKG